MNRKRLARILSLVFTLAMLVTFTCGVYAAGGVSAKDVYTASTWDDDEVSDVSEVPEWDVFVAAAEATTEDVVEFGPEQYQRYQNAVSIYNTFGTKSAYDKAVAKLKSYQISYVAETDELVPVNDSTKGQQDLARAVDSFNSSMGSQVAENTISGIFDTQNFNPSAGAAAGFLDTFYMVVNTIFFVVSNVVIWWFLAQTSFDMLYIMCEPLRPIIGPANSGNGGLGGSPMGQNAGWTAYVNKAINLLHLCSSEVAEACGGGGGGLGTNNAGGGNPWTRYFRKRAVVVICVGVYLVLVSAGWWPKIISWVAGIVTRLLGTIIS